MKINFNEAIDAYTSEKIILFFLVLFYCFVEAIETCPSESTEELSQFYQNRAAAWESLV